MKTFQSLSFLLGTIFILLMPKPSFSKETRLKCVEEINLHGKAIKTHPNQPYHLILLDDRNERYELPFQDVKGQVFYGANLIMFSFDKYGTAYDWQINRKTLKFSQHIKLIGGSSPTQLWKGSCKIISPASSGKNLI